MANWMSIFCRADDPGGIEAALRQQLTTLGYEVYEPFGLIPPKAYAQTVKLFVGPGRGGWVRVIGTVDDAVLAGLSAFPPALCVSLNGDEADFSVPGGDVVSTLADYLRPGSSTEDVIAAIRGPMIVPPRTAPAQPPVMAVPLEALPEDVRGMLGKVDSGAAESMFNRLSGTLMNKVGGQAEAAQALMAANAPPDWESIGGVRIRALLNCLTVPPDGWQMPDFTALRDAYPLHARRKRKPDARLYPGDAEALAAVPDALDYRPVFGGIRG
jgi:hypothetical protein